MRRVKRVGEMKSFRLYRPSKDQSKESSSQPSDSAPKPKDSAPKPKDSVPQRRPSRGATPAKEQQGQPKASSPQRTRRRGLFASKETPADSASQRKPRQAPRFSLPFGASAPRAIFLADNSAQTPAIQAHLWNVSDHGSCLTVQGPLPLTVPVPGQLEFAEPGGRGTRRLPAELRWISTVGEATFFGLRFLEGPLPADTHLREFMQQSWTDQVPGSRRSGS